MNRFLKKFTAPITRIFGADKFIEDDFEFRAPVSRDSGPPARYRAASNVLTVLTVITAALLIWRLIALGRYFYETKRVNALNEEAAQIIRDAVGREAPALTPAPSQSPVKPAPPDGANPADGAGPPAQEETAREIPPEISALRERFQNDDIIGYMSVQGTRINFPVVQGNDNEFYLTRDISGQKSAGGAVFLDAECSGDMTDPNNVFYGHNMRNGSQFHDLRYFVNAEYAKAHKTITLTTILGETEWEVFSAYSVSTEFDYIRTDFSPARPFGSFLADIKARSLIDMGNEAVDRVLTLSTCTNTADDMRYAVHARLVSED